MESRSEERGNIHKYFPEAKSVISVGMNYYTGIKQENLKSDYKFSNYAWGDDYHIILKDKQRLLSRVAFCLEYNDIMENNYGSKVPITPNSLVIQVTKPKKDLYENAELRFHQMINKGALEEVKSLYENKKISKTLYKAHGLPELLSCVRNKLSLDEAIYLGIKNTKRYIKRQFTWWNNQKFNQLNLRINYKKSFPKDSIENISIYLND